MSQASTTPGTTPTLGSAQDPIESVLGGGLTTGATAGDAAGGSGTVGNLGQYLQLVGLLSKVLGGGQGGGQQQMPAPMPIPHQAPQLSAPPIPPMQNITPPQAAILQRLLLGGGM